MSSRSGSDQRSGNYEHFPHSIHPFSFDRPPNDSAAVPDREKVEIGRGVQIKSDQNELGHCLISLGHSGLNADRAQIWVLS